MPWPLYHGDRTAVTHWIRAWLGPRTGLDAVAMRKKNSSLSLPGIEPW